jgi:hypothetical protein
MVPAQLQMEVEGDENGEDHQRNDLLNYLELNRAEMVCAQAVGWHLQAVLKKGNAPTDEDDLPQGFIAESEMAIPGEGHEDIRES